MRLKTLGGLRLEGFDFRRPKPLLLLAYLSLEGAQEPRHLAELFWPVAASPPQRLAATLNLLRRGAPGSVERDDVRVWTQVPADAAELLSAVEAGRLEQALGAYEGRFLEGLYLKDWGSELEEWVYGSREFIAGRVRAALLGSAERESGGGAFDRAAELADRAYLVSGAAGAEPEELERIYTLLIAGEASRAGEVRREAATFGLTLDASTTTARDRLRHDAAEGGQAVPNNLSPLPTSFIGRNLEITELTELLGRPELRLLTLKGEGGVGKTRIALQLAQLQLRSGQFEDGVHFVPLDALTDTDSIPYSLAAALNLDLSGRTDPLATITRHLEGRRALLVLDNLEHLRGGTTLISALLAGCPELKLVVTSREPLGTSEEWVYTLEGLRVTDEEGTDLEVVRALGAVELFVQRARRADLHFRLSEENAEAVLEVCRLVRGSPLGLELAAAWVRVLPVGEIAEEIASNLDFLASTNSRVSGRHRSMRATLEHSWELLSAAEQQVLRGLSVFRGGFYREAASEVVGATLPVLSRLVDASLLRVLPGGRFVQHPLTLQFGRSKLVERREEHAVVLEGHGRHYVRLLGATVDPVEGFTALDEEWENVRSAWSWASTERVVDALGAGAEVIWFYCLTRGRYREGIELYNQATANLSETEPGHSEALGALLVGQAYPEWTLGHVDVALSLAGRGVELLRREGDSEALAKGLDFLGGAVVEIGHFAEGKRYLEEALAMARVPGGTQPLTNILQKLVFVETLLGEYGRAEEYIRETYTTIRQQRIDESNIAFLLFSHSVLEHAAARYREEIALLLESLHGFREMRNIMGRGRCLVFLGRAYIEVGAYREASVHCQEALSLLQRIDLKQGETDAHAQLGRLAAMRGSDAEAEEHFRRGLLLAWSIRAVPVVLEQLVYVAEWRLARGEAERAGAWLCLVRHHEAAPRWVRERATRVLDEVRERLTPEAFAVTVERGRAFQLDAVLRGPLGSEGAAHP